MVETGSWNAFRSQKRSAAYTPPFAPWMVTALQLAKFLIFVVLHAMLLFGVILSKTAVILLATNLHPPSISAMQTKFAKLCTVNVKRTAAAHAAVYLALLLIQLIPDGFALVQCIFRLITVGRGQGGTNVALIVLEGCRAAGLSILFFLVFPQIDIMRCVFLLSCLPLLPVFQRVVASLSRSLRSDRGFIKRLGLLVATVPSMVTFMILLTGCYLWSILDTPFENVFLLPIALILASLGFWESWITTGHCGTFFHRLYQVKYGIRKLNGSTRLLSSLTRIIVVLVVFGCSAHKGKVGTEELLTGLFEWGPKDHHAELFASALSVCALHYVMRVCARLLAGLELRALPGLHPMFLAPPLMLSFFMVLCHISPHCEIGARLAKFGLTLRCAQWNRAPQPVSDMYIAVIWLIIAMYKGYQLLSQPDFDKNDEIIRAGPVFINGLSIEQSLPIFEFALRKNDSRQLRFDFDGAFHDSNTTSAGIKCEADSMANVYVCATMWHETENEMRQMFGSILKLDEEQAHIALKRSSSNFGTNETPRFRLEVHIFFDDAWEDQCELGRVPNEFFRTFFSLLNKMIDGKEDSSGRGPTKVLVSTAYGGRLVVRLPAGTLLFVHLKDKKLIRHKKRWSQVMYMYYLLGHRIMESHMSVEDKQVIADNTYILAIDGDSKFEPEAFLRLLNLMNAKSDIGCACGRIHPIGQGIMVWYQKFEYAIAHWFQKAAEHVFGCVLCAPGCFSLFRASALMDDNIMHKYTTTAIEPRHFVQYDQGEDRWLSTLLLKQGYRIEYAAASDAETYAPEGFDEFFNQRRRWTPSSVANTIDLLADYKRACSNNACISHLYIFYQFCVIGFSMLGPAIIFSMLVYAQVAAFHVSSDRIMMYNAVPIIAFIVTCFVLDSKMQLLLAKILSIGYAFVMLAVIVATCSQIVLETMFSPTSMFVVGMIVIFFFAACLHPREFTNIIYGIIFFLMIPATYVVLSFYSLINLNVINWGTREAVAKATGKEIQKDSLWDRFWTKILESPLGNMFKSDKAIDNSKLDEFERKLEEFRADLERPRDCASSVRPRKETDDSLLLEKANRSEMHFRTSNRDLWMDAEYLQVCEKGRLKASEQQFWDQLIDTYLKPIQTTAADNKQAADGLRGLRNHIAFSIIILNALMVLAIYLTQNHKDVLAFSWMPHENFKQYRWNSTVQEWTKQAVPLKVEFLGLSIIFALFGILMVQTFGMILHRLNTMVGAFQEIKAMGDFASIASTKKHDEMQILEIARAMLDTGDYSKAHGSSGYTRDVGVGQEAVLHRLQRARFAMAVRNHEMASSM